MNVSISELVVILLIALLVVKPEHMPGIAHKLGVLMGKMRRMIAGFKKDMGDFYDVPSNDKK